jgi:cytochrome c biogenesis protein CcmG/thiol:disulfide interchange protein DsbE
LKRNTIVLGITLFVLAVFAWAGWANYEYRKQAAEKMLANASHGELVAAGSTDDGGMTSSPLVGKPAPEFALVDLSGKKVSLSSYKGKAVLVNFWATWCGPCKLETPWIVQLRNQYASQGFEVLGIDAENDDLDPGDTAGLAKQKTAVAQFAQQEHMPYPILLNGDSITRTYGDFDAMPTSFYVDRNGTIVSVQRGISSKDDMEAKIRKILGAK